MTSIMAVVPTYNEAENLPLMTKALFDLSIDHFGILVVDDNSPDGTGQLADELAGRDARISVVHRPAKQGLGPAYICGFKQALSMDADLIIQIDADFSHQPKYIPEMIRQAQNYDLVIGSRYIKGGGVSEDWSFYRTALSRFANQFYTRAILNFPVQDATAGYRLWRRQTLAGIDLDQIHSTGYAFQVEMAYLAYRLGYKIKEIPIYFPDRKLGKSKMSLNIAIEAALRVWQIRYRHRKVKPVLR